VQTILVFCALFAAFIMPAPRYWIISGPYLFRASTLLCPRLAWALLIDVLGWNMAERAKMLAVIGKEHAARLNSKAAGTRLFFTRLLEGYGHARPSPNVS
jgi:hypothetical protein